jgi:hypothetical protein
MGLNKFPAGTGVDNASFLNGVTAGTVPPG